MFSRISVGRRVGKYEMAGITVITERDIERERESLRVR